MMPIKHWAHALLVAGHKVVVPFKDNLACEVLPKRIEDHRVKQSRGKELSLVKIVQGEATEESAIWKQESLCFPPSMFKCFT